MTDERCERLYLETVQNARSLTVWSRQSPDHYSIETASSEVSDLKLFESSMNGIFHSSRCKQLGTDWRSSGYWNGRCTTAQWQRWPRGVSTSDLRRGAWFPTDCKNTAACRKYHYKYCLSELNLHEVCRVFTDCSLGYDLTRRHGLCFSTSMVVLTGQSFKSPYAITSSKSFHIGYIIHKCSTKWKIIRSVHPTQSLCVTRPNITGVMATLLSIRTVNNET